jgi:glycosyltransferase involved in cell wall biosynthesis
MNVRPLVSILIPCYNAGLFLKECLESALAQTYPNIEILAYDDGSTDDTWEVLQKFSPNVKSFRSLSNGGVCRARNFLLYKAQGDYVHYQDADDLMHPRFTELMLPWLLIGEYEVVLCNGDYFIENNPQNLQGGWYVRPRLHGEDWLAYIIQVGGQNINSLYKREALYKIGGFREILRCAEDFDLHIRLAENGFHFATVGQSLLKERRKKEHFYGKGSDYGISDNLLIASYKVLADLCKRLEMSPKKISEEVTTVLAERLWHTARLLTEIGEHRYAIQAIKLSQKVGKCRRIPGSFIYQILIRILGVALAERSRFYWHKIKRLTRISK